MDGAPPDAEGAPPDAEGAPPDAEGAPPDADGAPPVSDDEPPDAGVAPVPPLPRGSLAGVPQAAPKQESPATKIVE